MSIDESAHYFPITLRIDKSRIVIVGGGIVAARKIRLLSGKKAKIEVFAKEICQEIKILQHDNDITILGEITNKDDFHQHIHNCRLVFVATDDHAYNAVIAEWANEVNIPICAVDNSEISTFITPAIIDRDPVQIAISTGGAAPVLSRRIRESIEPLLSNTIGKLALFMGKNRAWLKKQFPKPFDRQKIWQNFIDGKGASLLETQQPDRALAYIKSLAKNCIPKIGQIYLVGAGPGDPDLLTLKALHCLQNADVILYDHLLSPDILGRIRRDAQLIYVGKQRKNHTLPQKEINELLLLYVRQGKQVVRLKGGDPFIFGRGGEEAEFLVEANVPFQIIPGISAANGCAAYSGIPLTHRDCAQACLILTGHTQNGNTPDLPWQSMLDRHQTLVIYMGLTTLEYLCSELIKRGLPASWPAATIEKGTLPEQKLVIGTLETLPKLVKEKQFKSPVLTIIGQVVSHRVESVSLA